jgi:glycosyltransferase involved in cell wall biosynthesis
VPAGILHCRRHRPDVILSTYPIASAHYIGWLLGKITRVPWVADFRDPMAQDDYPPDIRLRRALHNLEHRVVENATRIFVTTQGTHHLYSRRYPGLPPDRLLVVPNGYDPAILDGPGGNRSKNSEKRILVHSGNIYRNERDPTHFFEALASLKNDEPELMNRVRIMLRGTRHTEYFQEIVKRLDIGSIVVFGEPVTYQAAVSEMQSADGLLILQARNCNEQIPAKVYEYMYVRKPIIALTDPVGDTARLLASCGVTSVARLDDSGSISRLLKKFLNGDPSGLNVDENFDVAQFSRQQIALTVSSELSKLAG